jgi:hypothetical protein
MGLDYSAIIQHFESIDPYKDEEMKPQNSLKISYYTLPKSTSQFLL